MILVILVAGILYDLHARNYETTDDAEVDAHLIPITARVDGTIRGVYVEDDAIVKAGQPLVDLDPTDSPGQPYPGPGSLRSRPGPA